MSDMPSELEKRLQDLRLDNHQAKRAHKAQKKLRREGDLSVGRAARFRFSVAMGVVWTMVYLAAALPAVGVRALELDPGMWTIAQVGIPLLLLIIWRRMLLNANGANRRIIFGLLGLLGTLGFARVAGHLGGVAPEHVQLFEYFFYGLAAVSVGLISDRRIALLGPPCFAAAMIAAAFPSIQLFLLAGLSALCFGYMAWIWRPNARGLRPTTGKSLALEPICQPRRAQTAS